MDTKKAQEIVESKGVINVSYKGSSVWIENINNETHETMIRDLNTNRNFVVDISELIES